MLFGDATMRRNFLRQLQTSTGNDLTTFLMHNLNILLFDAAAKHYNVLHWSSLKSTAVSSKITNRTAICKGLFSFWYGHHAGQRMSTAILSDGGNTIEMPAPFSYTSKMDDSELSLVTNELVLSPISTFPPNAFDTPRSCSDAEALANVSEAPVAQSPVMETNFEPQCLKPAPHLKGDVNLSSETVTDEAFVQQTCKDSVSSDDDSSESYKPPRKLAKRKRAEPKRPPPKRTKPTTKPKTKKIPETPKRVLDEPTKLKKQITKTTSVQKSARFEVSASARRSALSFRLLTHTPTSSSQLIDNITHDVGKLISYQSVHERNNKHMQGSIEQLEDQIADLKQQFQTEIKFIHEQCTIDWPALGPTASIHGKFSDKVLMKKITKKQSAEDAWMEPYLSRLSADAQTPKLSDAGKRRGRPPKKVGRDDIYEPSLKRVKISEE